MRWLLRWVGLGCVMLLLMGFAASPREYVWQRIDTEVAVQPDGRLLVTEKLTLRYTGGPFTFVFRDLPNRRLDEIRDISVREGDRAYRQVSDEESREPFTFSVFREDGAQRVRWVYPETVGGTRSFELRYTVLGAVRRSSNADELWWSMVFPEREVPVEQAQGRIRLPVSVPAAQLEASAPDVSGEVMVQPGLATVQAQDIAPGRELTLRLRFPTGIVGGDIPAWQARELAQEAYNTSTRPIVNTGLSLLAALLLLLLGGGLWRWWLRNRDPLPQGFVARELPDAPDDLPPALAARLLRSLDAQATLGTLFDLANRGYLSFRESMGGWRGRTRQVVVTSTGKDRSELAPYEQALLDALFAGENEVILNEQRADLLKAMAAIGKQHEATLIERGYLDTQRLAQRRRGIIIGVVLMIIGGVGFIPATILAEAYSWWLPVVALVVLVAGIAWTVAGSMVRGVTAQGADALLRWRAFRAYLRRIGAAQASMGQFAQLLPYAVAIADARQLTRAYAATSEPLPVWYYPMVSGSHTTSVATMGGDGGTLMLHDFSQNFLTTLSSTSSSISSGGSDGGGGGGGASGGGGGGAG